MSRRSIVRLGVMATAIALPAAAVCIPASAAASPKASVHGSQPSWAAAANKVGHADPKSKITIRVGLAPRDAAGAEAFAAAVSDPASASYGEFLTPAQYHDQFGPSDANVAAVKSFLASSGLHVDGVNAAGDAVTATGTAKQLEAAFGTTLNVYKHAGHKLRAPAGPAQIPAGLSSVVLSVAGLTDTSAAIRPNTKTPDAPGGASAPAGATKPVIVPTQCSSYYGQYHVGGLPLAHGTTSFPTYICGYEPAQVRGAYGLSTANLARNSDGFGTTVAIVDAYASPTMATDAAYYSQLHGLPTPAYAEYPPSTPYYLQTECGASGWALEEALDVEAVHSMAPGARILYVPTSSCQDQDFLDAYSRILGGKTATKPLASIVSNSYGDSSDLLPGDLQNQEHAMFVQGAAEGVGFYFSSGDSGDAAALNNGVPQPQASANDPAVTAVGGTSLGVDQNNGYQFETGWGDDRTYLVTNHKTQSWLSVPGPFAYGAGGGTSAVWAEPSYQKGVVPNALASSLSGNKGPGRVVPDVAADADPYTGFLIGYSTPDKKGNPVYGEGDIGGTSLACPLFAGLMAVAQQRARHTLGFANPLIYSAKVRSTLTDVSHPKTSDQQGVVFTSTAAGVTRLVTFDHDSSLNTAPGYDNVTGLGTPNASFIAAVAKRG